MAPPSGTYFVQNYKSKYYLTATSDDNSGKPVFTKDPKGSLGDATKFTVTLVPGTPDFYTITSNDSFRPIGNPETSEERAPIIWSTTAQQYRIVPAGSEFFFIVHNASGRLWFDDEYKGHPVNTVLAKTGSRGDEVKWSFTAAP